MTCIISHTTALAYWATRGPGERMLPIFAPQELSDITANAQDAHTAGIVLAAVGLQDYGNSSTTPRRPLHLLVHRRSARRKSTGIVYHAQAARLNNNDGRFSGGISPERFACGTFCRLTHGVWIASPEQCLLEMAGILPSVCQLVEVVNLLCGQYYLSPDGKDRVGTRKSLTSRAAIRSYLTHMSGRRWANRLNRALAFSHDLVASPPENFIATEFGLPTQLGGRGFPEFECNRRYDLKDSRLSRAIGKKYLVEDVGFVGSKNCIEWDSYEEHMDKQAYDWTQKRANLLRADGVQVFSLTFGQVVGDVFDDTVWAIEEQFRFLHPTVSKAERLLQHQVHSFLFRPGRRLF